MSATTARRHFLGEELYEGTLVVGLLVAVMWVVEIIN